MINQILPLLGFIFGALISFFILRHYYKKNINNFHDKNSLKTREENIALETKLSHHENTITDLKKEKVEFLEEFENLKTKNTILETEKIQLDETIKNRKLDIDEIKKQLPNEFQNLANKIFSEKSDTFKKESKNTLNDIVNPLNQEIGKLKKDVLEKFGSESKERHTLQNEIKNLIKAQDDSKIIESEKIKEITRFTDALTQDTKKQGDFGELILEQILLDSGLIEGKNYILQGKDLKLKDEKSNPQKPDVILKIPGDKHIIIDSKVSLTSFVDYHRENNTDTKKIHLKKFLRSVKDHISELSLKRYQDQYKLNSLEYVIMFMPRKNAYDLAINSDPNLQLLAEKNDINISHEGNIIALLKLIYRIWRLENVNEDALSIIKKADIIDEKINTFLTDHYEKIGRNINSLQNSYQDGLRKLDTSKDSITNKSKELKQIGDSSKKILTKKNDSDEN